ncbi:MAG: phospholipase, partial [Rhodospirillaceae bacterium]
MVLHGPHRPAASGKARQAVILLHGYGADGSDLIGLAPHLALGLPDAAFYSPDAGSPCEMGPLGRQWFSLSDYDPDLLRRRPETMQPAYAAMLDGAFQAAPAIEAFVGEVMEREGLTDSASVAFIGFSQGT